MARITDVTEIIPWIAERGLRETLESIEYSAVVYVLRQTDNDFTTAAKFLGINRTTLVEIRRRYGLRLRKRNSGRYGKLEYRKRSA